MTTRHALRVGPVHSVESVGVFDLSGFALFAGTCLIDNEIDCQFAATQQGYTLGGAGFAFVGQYDDAKGCYAYASGQYAGMAWFSTGGTIAQMEQAADTSRGQTRLSCPKDVFSSFMFLFRCCLDV